MLSVVVPRFGGPDVLKLVEKPVPQAAADQVVVKISFAGITYGDVYQREGTYRAGNPLKDTDAPLPIGGEGVGIIDSVGADVQHLKKGDRVAYAEQLGSYSEYVAVPAWRVIKIPDALSLQDAAAAYAQALTAHYLAFDTGKLQSGMSCLIHAAAGGVGHILLQFAKMHGVRVLATVGNAKKAAFVKALGADEVIQYHDVDFLERVRSVTDGKGVDVVYDSVGIATIDKSIQATRTHGLCVLYGNSSGLVTAIDPMALAAAGSIYFTRPRLSHHVRSHDEIARRASDTFNAMMAGKLKVSVHGVFPFSQAAEAHRLLQARESTGRILLRPE